MHDQDLISIVVPVYNTEPVLPRCIRSLRQQSYQNLEIILVDDGSSDHSPDICTQAAQSDSRIKVIHQENGGVASARNAGMDAMTGQWLLLIDGDDYIHPDMAWDLLRAAKKNHAQTAICGFSHVYPDSRPALVFQLHQAWSGDRHAFAEEMLLPLYRNLLLRTQSNKLFSAEIIQQNHLRYPGDFSINEDIWFCTRYLTFCERMACIPGSYLYYWQNAKGNSQISRYHSEGVESCFLLLSAMRKFLESADATKKTRMEMENEMLFHICGFAGHSYYRTLKKNRECLEEIRQLAERREMKELLANVQPKGAKNRVAKLLLSHGQCRLYHWLCLTLYGKQRRALRKTMLDSKKVMSGSKNAEKEKKKEQKLKKTINQETHPSEIYHPYHEPSEKIMVSISCVAYNHGPYIAQSLDSYLMQKTNFNFEILVYDDVSTDNTREIILDYARRYPDIIKPYFPEENQYSQGKYNVEGFFNYPRAKGKYSAMCDGDDYWTDENKLQLQVDYMETHPECAMCFHAARIETAQKAVQLMEIRPYKKSCIIPTEKVIDKMFNYPTASLMFRTEYTRDLQDYYYTSPVGDIPIQLHMAAKGTVYYIDRKMSVYRQGVTTSWSALMKEGNYKQNLIDHHNAMKEMYRAYSRETDGKYDAAIERACRRMDFLTLLNVKEYDKALLFGYRCFYRELPLRTRLLIRFEVTAPGLFMLVRRMVFGKERI